MKAEVQGMNSCLESDGFDIRKKAVEKVVADAGLLKVVKASALGQILDRGPEEVQFYSKRLRNSDLASSQATVSMRPFLKSSSVLASTSPCQARLLYTSRPAAKSAQSSSIISSFSPAGNLRKSAMLITEINLRRLINHCKRQVSRCGGRKPDGGGGRSEIEF
jgi:hypothetical protein